MEMTMVSTRELQPGKMIGVEKDGKSILIANVNGMYYAIGNTCTHMGCRVSDGILKGDRVQCPCHGSTFDVRTGAVVKGPAKKPEPSYKVELSGDQISVVV